MRKLASIQKIESIRPIEGADKIVCARILGWECVVKKDEFKVGESIIYIEVDSKLPESEVFEFMRERKFRVKTIKLRGQISQGLVVPITFLPEKYRNEPIGTDVTDILGIVKHDPQREKELKLLAEEKARQQTKLSRFFSKYTWYRRLFKKPVRETFPSFIHKTDETRIQNIPALVDKEQGTEFIMTEKLDGQSGTYFLVRKGRSIFGMPKYVFGVCSRNFLLTKEDNSSYWTIARNFKMKEVLKELIGKNEFVVIQGEILGTGIQGNKYNVTGYDFYAFNLIYPNEKVDSCSARDILKEKNIKFVPILDEKFVLNKNIQEMVELSKGKTILDVKPNKPIREGLVLRNYKKDISFKVISPEFLLKNDE